MFVFFFGFSLFDLLYYFFFMFWSFHIKTKVQSTTLNNEIILHFLKTTSLLSNPVIVAPRLWRTFNFKTRSSRRMVNVTIHLSPSPSNTDSCGFISLRIMCIEELKLRVKVRPSATVRRALGRLFKRSLDNVYESYRLNRV